jgi:hypothetical protein
MSLNIEDFKANFLGGARSNKFIVEVPLLPEKAKFLIKAAPLPGANIGEVIMNYQGNQVKIAGDKTFNDWEVTLILDEDYAGFNEIEAWHELIKADESSSGANNHTLYKKDCYIRHLGQNGETIAEYKLVGAWPKVIPDTALAWETSDAVAEVNITFSYDYRKRIA